MSDSGGLVYHSTRGNHRRRGLRVAGALVTATSRKVQSIGRNTSRHYCDRCGQKLRACTCKESYP